MGLGAIRVKSKSALRTPFGWGLIAALAVGACGDSPTEPPTENLPDIEASYAASAPDIAIVRLLNQAGGWEQFRLPSNPERLADFPQDPQNRLTQSKIALGQLLYHETALAVGNERPEGRETYSCAACHFAQAGFQANLPQGIAEGGSGFGVDGDGRVLLDAYDSNPDDPDVQPIRTPTTLNSAFQELMLWNGQFGGVGDNIGTEPRWIPGTPLGANALGLHGLETQAQAGLGVHRMIEIEDSRVAQIAEYQMKFADAFPGADTAITRLNAALAIAAYERSLVANLAPFQRWLRGEQDAMSAQEKEGAAVFFGPAGCVDCHTGPALNSMTFHALGMGDIDQSVDVSRVTLMPAGGGVPLNVELGRGGFTGRPEDQYKFKTPQLYNLTDSPFHGHGGSFSSVRAVVEYKNAAVAEHPSVPQSQLAPQFAPLGLGAADIDALTVFLERALRDPDLMRYAPTSLPSGNCFPVNDAQARIDLDCS